MDNVERALDQLHEAEMSLRGCKSGHLTQRQHSLSRARRAVDVVVDLLDAEQSDIFECANPPTSNG